MHRAQRHHVVVAAAIAHHTHAFHWQKYDKSLAGQLVPALAADGVYGAAQLFDEDGVGAAQQIGEFLLYLAQNAHAQARAGEGVAVHHGRGQTEGDAEFAHLVFEEVAQRLQQFEPQLLGQTTHVVVAFDGDGLLALGAAGFDHVRVDGALRQPLGTLAGSTTGDQLGGLGLEHLNKFAPDDLALGLWIAHSGKLAKKLLGRVNPDHLGVQLAHKHVHHQVAFVQAQQAVVDKDAGELIANGAVNQRCRHRRINPAREAQNDILSPDLLADFLHRLGNVIAHHPVGRGLADVEHKALQ